MEAMLGNRSINAYLVRLEIDGEIAAPSKVSADITDKARKVDFARTGERSHIMHCHRTLF